MLGDAKAERDAEERQGLLLTAALRLATLTASIVSHATTSPILGAGAYGSAYSMYGGGSATGAWTRAMGRLSSSWERCVHALTQEPYVFCAESRPAPLSKKLKEWASVLLKVGVARRVADDPCKQLTSLGDLVAVPPNDPRLLAILAATAASVSASGSGGGAEAQFFLREPQSVTRGRVATLVKEGRYEEAVRLAQHVGDEISAFNTRLRSGEASPAALATLLRRLAGSQAEGERPPLASRADLLELLGTLSSSSLPSRTTKRLLTVVLSGVCLLPEKSKLLRVQEGKEPPSGSGGSSSFAGGGGASSGSTPQLSAQLLAPTQELITAVSSSSAQKRAFAPPWSAESSAAADDDDGPSSLDWADDEASMVTKFCSLLDASESVDVTALSMAAACALALSPLGVQELAKHASVLLSSGHAEAALLLASRSATRASRAIAQVAAAAKLKAAPPQYSPYSGALQLQYPMTYPQDLMSVLAPGTSASWYRSPGHGSGSAQDCHGDQHRAVLTALAKHLEICLDDAVVTAPRRASAATGALAATTAQVFEAAKAHLATKEEPHAHAAWAWVDEEAWASALARLLEKMLGSKQPAVLSAAAELCASSIEPAPGPNLLLIKGRESSAHTIVSAEQTVGSLIKCAITALHLDASLVPASRREQLKAGLLKHAKAATPAASGASSTSRRLPASALQHLSVWAAEEGNGVTAHEAAQITVALLCERAKATYHVQSKPRDGIASVDALLTMRQEVRAAVEEALTLDKLRLWSVPVLKHYATSFDASSTQPIAQRALTAWLEALMAPVNKKALKEEDQLACARLVLTRERANSGRTSTSMTAKIDEVCKMLAPPSALALTPCSVSSTYGRHASAQRLFFQNVTSVVNAAATAAKTLVENVTKQVECHFKLAELLGSEHLAIAKEVVNASQAITTRACREVEKNALSQLRTITRTCRTSHNAWTSLCTKCAIPLGTALYYTVQAALVVKATAASDADFKSFCSKIDTMINGFGVRALSLEATSGAVLNKCNKHPLARVPTTWSGFSQPTCDVRTFEAIWDHVASADDAGALAALNRLAAGDQVTALAAAKLDAYTPPADGTLAALARWVSGGLPAEFRARAHSAIVDGDIDLEVLSWMEPNEPQSARDSQS